MRRRLQEQTGATPMGDPRIPYDQTDPMVQEAAPQPGVSDGLGAPGDPSLQGPTDMSAAGGALPMLSSMGQDPGLQDLGLGGLPADAGAGGSTDQMSDVQLAGLDNLDQGLMSPEDLQLQQMEQALTDPNTSPDEQQMIQQQLDLAARRRMLGGLGA